MKLLVVEIEAICTHKYNEALRMIRAEETRLKNHPKLLVKVEALVKKFEKVDDDIIIAAQTNRWGEGERPSVNDFRYRAINLLVEKTIHIESISNEELKSWIVLNQKKYKTSEDLMNALVPVRPIEGRKKLV